MQATRPNVAACAIRVARRLTGGFVGALAVLAKRERSSMILLSVLLGAFVLYWTIAEIIGQ